MDTGTWILHIKFEVMDMIQYGYVAHLIVFGYHRS